MKTYLLDTYNRYKRFSEALDVKTKLCNRPWVVFNDGDEREVYKFKEDGTIKIILSGRVSTGTWEYDPSDQTLEIAVGNQAFMVHPGIYEDMLMGLQLDGTNECAFLIEENNVQNFAPRTYTELIGYFQQKEQKQTEIEEKIRQNDIWLQHSKQTEEVNIRKFEEYLEKKKYIDRVKKLKTRKYWVTFISIFGLCFLGAYVPSFSGGFYLLLFFLGIPLIFSTMVLIETNNHYGILMEFLKRYIEENRLEPEEIKILEHYCFEKQKT